MWEHVFSSYQLKKLKIFYKLLTLVLYCLFQMQKPKTLSYIVIRKDGLSTDNFVSCNPHLVITIILSELA